MTLATHLIKNKLITGPLVKNSSYSHCGRLKNDMLGLPQFSGDEAFLKVGSALHEIFLEDVWDTYNTLTKEQKIVVDGMLKSLHANKAAAILYKNSIREERVEGKLFNNVTFTFILDGKQPHLKTGFDLKTTTALTRAQCLDRVYKFHYNGQAYIYKKLAKLNSFYFVFVCKIYPHPVFIISYKEVAAHEAKVIQELNFLTYFYKHYGNIITI